MPEGRFFVENNNEAAPFYVFYQQIGGGDIAKQGRVIFMDGYSRDIRCAEEAVFGQCMQHSGKNGLWGIVLLLGGIIKKAGSRQKLLQLIAQDSLLFFSFFGSNPLLYVGEDGGRQERIGR